MPFPFLPIGAVVAAAVLGGAYAVFAGLLRLVDRAALTVRDSIAPGVVAGMRNWSRTEPFARRASSPPPSGPSLGAIRLDQLSDSLERRAAEPHTDELTEAPDVVTERVHAHAGRR